jgi:tetratricopeptide (TPR) repeat protein
MGFLGRFLGSDRSNAFSEGLALLEEERFAEAADRFRRAVHGRSDSPSSTLASFHFRQALVAEGRRLMRANQHLQAVPFFEEAVQLWGLYPDLHCLLGTAQGLGGDWGQALLSARSALRLNSDYVEARLLEAVALASQDRRREAAQSLDNLVEAGRRLDHWLIANLGGQGNFSPENIPENLVDLLDQAVGGRSEKEEVAAAVAQCRAGNWEEGLGRFEALVQKRPRYPDYRTRHAAAFFQLGRNEEALAEVEAALALNENYRTAIDLKGLVLADSGRIYAARTFLESSESRKDSGREEGPQGDLFGAYLRGSLALLTGEPEAVGELFDGYTELARNFARAELLMAASDSLLGRSAVCERRLVALVEEWPNEASYYFLLGCHFLELRRYQELTDLLGRWPARERKDMRPLYLAEVLTVARDHGRPVSRPTSKEGPIREAAWNFLTAQSDFHGGRIDSCWSACRELESSGHITERVLKLMAQAARHGGVADMADWEPPQVVPDTCLPPRVFLHIDRQEQDQALVLVNRFRDVHPELLTGYWLSPDFWLEPIRNWIG